MSPQQQNPDGSWSDAQPLGWQGHGIDWELYWDRKRAEAWDEDVLVAAVEAKTRWGLARKMRKTEKKLGLRRNSVLG